MRWGGARRPPRSLPRAPQPGRPIPATPHPARPHRLHGVLQDGRELGKHPVPGLQQLLPGRPGELLDAPPPPLLRLPGPLQSEGGCGRGAEDGGRAGGAAALGARGARRAAPRTLGWDSGPHGARWWRWRRRRRQRTRWQEAQALPAALPAASCRGRQCGPGKPRPPLPAALDVGRGAQRRRRRGGRGRRGAPGAARARLSVSGAGWGFRNDTLTWCLRVHRTGAGTSWEGR